MAERRMFSIKIVESDAFSEMPLSTQALYFHLNMNADDDGFLNNANKIRRSIGAAEDDLRLLIDKRFVLTFPNGVMVIKHWLMHNRIRKDRYKPTQYTKEKEQLTIRDDDAYTEKIDGIPSDNQVTTNGIPSDNQWLPQDRLGKDSIGEDSIGDKIVKIDTSAVAPFTPSVLTKELIECGYISSDDICIDMYNNAIQDVIDGYSFEMARSCVWYFCRRYKENPMDENGNAIENKVAYFSTAINNSADRLYRENNRLTSGVGSWLYS